MLYTNLQLITGESIVATCVGMNSNGYNIKYPLKIVVSMTNDGDTQIAFIRYMPFVNIEYEFFVEKRHVVMQGPVTDNMVKMYQQSVLAVTKKPKKSEPKKKTNKPKDTGKKDYIM